MQELIDAVIARIETTQHKAYDTDVSPDAAMPRVVVSAPIFDERRTTESGEPDLHSYLHVKYVGFTAAQVRIVARDVRAVLKAPFDVDVWRMWLALPTSGPVNPDGNHLEPTTSARVFAATDTYSVDATRK